MFFSFYPEFSFFLVLLVLLLGLYALFLRRLLDLFGNSAWSRKLLAGVLVGALFLFSREIGVFLLVFLALSALPGNRKAEKELPFVFLLSIIGGCLFFAFYFSKMETGWETLNWWVVSFLDFFHIHQGYQFIDVYAIFRFFRAYYPGLLLGLSIFELLRNRWASKKTITCYYRYTKGFSHILLIPFLFFVIGLALASFLPETHQIRRYFLNFSILFSLPYLLYGGLTLAYGLRRFWKNIIWFSLVFYSLIIFSGPLFLFILIIVIGVGVSDIWMNYNRRLKKHLF